VRARAIGGVRSTEPMETCRFAAPWSIEELAEYFIVRDPAGRRGYFCYDDEEHRRAVNKHLTKDTARRMAVKFCDAARLGYQQRT
jgi:hypothetical protein